MSDGGSLASDDLLIVDAHIVDGTGNPWYRGEVDAEWGEQRTPETVLINGVRADPLEVYEGKRLDERGVLERGMYANLVVVDPGAVIDRATYELP